MGMISFLAGLFTLQSIKAGWATLSLVAHKVAMVATATWAGIAAAAVWLLNFALTPLGLVIIGIIAIVAAAILVWKYWDEISAFLIKTWEKFDKFMTDKFGPTWEALKGVVSAIIEIWKNLFLGFVALFTGDWKSAKEFFGKALKGMKDVFLTVWGAIWKFFDNLMTKLFGGKWEFFKTTVKIAVEFVEDLFQGLWLYLKGIWDLIVGIFTGDTDKIKQGFKGIINGIITMWNALIKMVNKFEFTAPEWVPFVGGKSWGPSIPEIPMLAEGGIVTKPTLAMIGEGGAEAVIPLNKRNGGTGTVININILGPTYGFDDFEDRVATSIRSGVRRGGFQGILNTG